jgi:hypothetical protein
MNYYATRQLGKAIDKLREVLNELTVQINIHLHEIKDAIHSIDENAKSYQNKEHTAPKIVATLHEEESSQHERRTTNRSTQRRDRTRLVVEVLTFLAVFGYGLVTVFMWKEMRRTNDLTQKALNGSSQALDQTLAEMSDQAEQTGRLADETHTANQNVLAADRPWFGGTITVNDFEVGKTPTAVHSFINSGKRPAEVQSVRCASHFYFTFPKNLDYQKVELSSRGFAVPGTGFTTTLTLFDEKADPNFIRDRQPTTALMQGLDAKKVAFFVYAKIEYRDVRSGESHFTHVCVQYTPATHGTKAGFYGCETYNDGN